MTPSVSPPYHYGDVVVLTESPSTGYSFSSWSGDGTGTGATRSVTVTGNMAVTATFTQNPQNQYTLTVNTSGQGSVSMNPSQASYAAGSTVQLTATPAAGWSFVGWSGDLSGSTNPATITMSSAKTVTATFDFIYACNKFNTQIWGYTWTAPTVSNGMWAFNAPTGSTTCVQAVTKAATFGYGTYTVTFRMTTMTSGVTWSFFLYLDKTASGGAYNELDIPEVNPSYRPTNRHQHL